MQTYSLSHHTPSPFHRFLTQLGRQLRSLIKQVREQLTPDTIRIWQSRDHRGNLYWNAYDPQSGRKVTVTCQEDLIAWLEHAEPLGEIEMSSWGQSPFPYPLSNRFSPHL